MHTSTVFSDKYLKEQAGFCPAVHHAGKVLVLNSVPLEIQIIAISPERICGLLLTPLTVGENCMLAFDATLDERIRRINLWGAIEYCCAQKDAFYVEILNSDCDSMSRHYLYRLAN